MKAVTTEYDGFLFRSRLEARWAVFFDEAGIDYRYEPEGFELPWRLTPSWTAGKTFRYLPDFWLPDLGLWAEVKGAWSAAERVKALNAAAALSEAGNDVLLLGDTFRQPRGGGRRPWRLHLVHADTLLAYPWATDGLLATAEDATTVDLLRGHVSETPVPDTHKKAARAAQRARFEYGETPTKG